MEKSIDLTNAMVDLALMSDLEIDLVAAGIPNIGAKLFNVAGAVSTIEWLGDKAYQLGFYLGSH